MNLFHEYQQRILKSLRDLEKKKLLLIPKQNYTFALELPPKNQSANISCNAAMTLAKINKSSPIKLAEIIKKHLLLYWMLM